MYPMELRLCQVEGRKRQSAEQPAFPRSPRPSQIRRERRLAADETHLEKRSNLLPLGAESGQNRHCSTLFYEAER